MGLHLEASLNNKKQKEPVLALRVSSFDAGFGADFALGVGLYHAHSIYGCSKTCHACGGINVLTVA